jgi:hypothetical protein
MKAHPFWSAMLSAVFLFSSASAATGDLHGNAASWWGSFTHRHHTETGHDYIYEYRLWRNGDAISGIYLEIAGLEGGGIPPVIDTIIEGSLGANGQVLIKTKWYVFSGVSRADRLEGTLSQGDEIRWGGMPGNNVMIFTRGTNIRGIQEPAKKDLTQQELRAWIDSLAGRKLP